MPAVEAVGIISKPGAGQAVTVVPELLAWLEARGIQFRIDEETARYAKRDDGLDRAEVPDGIQLMVVLGGDGTLLSAVRAIGGRDIPLFAVNLGGLGFLTAITVEELYIELARALNGDGRIGKRRMLRCEIWRQDARIAEYDALNDLVLNNTEIARMIDLEVHVDNHFVCVYKADGLIVSTPTGSTAYSLSAGGPIMFPSVAALCIAPICPHTLTNRPVVVPDESVIQVINLGDHQTTYLTVDGQIGEMLRQNDRVICRRSDAFISLIRPPNMLFFDVLREKLKWGSR